MPNLNFTAQVRLEIYRLFVESGNCPLKTDIASSLNCTLHKIDSAFAELAQAHMLVLQPETGEVLMANPLSAVPTPFAVTMEHPAGTRNWYANCIWDGLGVIAMLQTDGRVVTSCGCCGEKMTVEVKGREVASRPEGIVHFALPARQWWDDIVFN